ncbi:MAG: thioredoxin family protein [Candidatus Micrarchaeota archaeon]
MDKRILTAMLAIALVALFGCTGGEPKERIVYDCSKCNMTEPPPVAGNILTMIVPPSCTESLCSMEKTRGWASEVGLELNVYNASWAQGPIILLYTDKDAFVFQKAGTRGDFMQGICDFLGDNKACDTAKEERANSSIAMKSCLEKNGLTMGTMMFYHADWCPHCAKMKPIVEELENNGYKFYWIEEKNETAITVLNDCLTTVIDPRGGYPQFGCPSLKKAVPGEMSKEELENFVKACVSAAQ